MDTLKLDEMKLALEELASKAKQLLDDPNHGRSPHAGSLRSRLTAALDSLENHTAWLAANPAKAAAN